MFGFLGKSSRKLIGIDVSSSAVKVLELNKSGGKYRVESYAVQPLQANAVVERKIVDAVAVGDAIRRTIAKSGTSLTQAAVAVPVSQVITKTLYMSADLSENDIENEIVIDADQHIPFPLDEVAMDFDVIGPADQRPNQVEVLLAACRNENIEQQQDALEVGGMVAKIIDVESFAIERAFKLIEPQIELQDPDAPVAFLDIGSTLTTLSILKGGRTVYTREQMFGGRQLTEEIMRRYGLSESEAGKLKKQGGLPDDYAAEVLAPFKEAVVQQVSRALQFFYSTSKYQDVGYIVLSGGSASIQGIARFVEEKIGIPAIVANPFADMQVSSRVNAAALESDAPALAIACGLAMRGVE